MKVILDIRCDFAYCSYYRYGLEQYFGNQRLHYSLAPFKELSEPGNNMRFIIEKDGVQAKYYLHLDDSYEISVPDYEWCDVYGCVNANYSHFPKTLYPKLVALAPSFAIRDTILTRRIVRTIINFVCIPKAIVSRSEWNKYEQKEEVNSMKNLKHYFGRAYKSWKNRLPLSAYNLAIPSEDDYIFFLSTLWHNDEWNRNDETVNLRRARFIRACKSFKNIHFEGGLLADESSSKDKFTDVLATHKEPFEAWLEKTKRSTLVFNTPAFWNCHGWKLGEYLALGKCIVSTKLSNDLPYPLEHGVNIHFVEDREDAMHEAIEYIMLHPDYRHQLEQGARAYWEKYGSPEAGLKLLGIQ